MRTSHVILAALVALATFFSLRAAARRWSGGPAGYYGRQLGPYRGFGRAGRANPGCAAWGPSAAAGPAPSAPLPAPGK